VDEKKLKKVRELLERMFDRKRRFADVEDYERKRHEFVFHMIDWEDDLRELYKLYDRPLEHEARASEIVTGYLIHTTSHLNAAGRLLLDDVPDPFKEREIPEGWEMGDREYREHLLQIGDKLPKSAAEFLLSNWYYNWSDPRCPHGGSIENVSTTGLHDAKESESEQVHIKVTLSNHCDSGSIVFRYINVYRYRMAGSECRLSSQIWSMDRIGLTPRGTVVHLVEVNAQDEWCIECEDIEHQYVEMNEPFHVSETM
jgi:hypothetical protein